MLVAIMSIGYRGMANKRYLPVIFGRETKAAFLSRNLNFNFGDFYDIDGYFATHISPHDRVLLYGFHNEYYVDFPFVDNSYLRKGEKFDYIAIQHGTLPKRFANLSEIYHNTTTGVTLYHLPHNPWMSY